MAWVILGPDVQATFMVVHDASPLKHVILKGDRTAQDAWRSRLAEIEATEHAVEAQALRLTDALECAGGYLSDGPREVEAFVRAGASVDDLFARLTEAVHEQVRDERTGMPARRDDLPGDEAA